MPEQYQHTLFDVAPLTKRATELYQQLKPDVCICFVGKGNDDLYIAGVLDFVSAEAWRRQDDTHRCTMTFTYGVLKMEDGEDFEYRDGDRLDENDDDEDDD